MGKPDASTPPSLGTMSRAVAAGCAGGRTGSAVAAPSEAQ